MGTRNRPASISIATSLTLAAIVLVVIVGGAVLWLSAATIRQDAEELTREKAAILAQVVVDRIARQLDPVVAMGEQLAAMFGEADAATLDPPTLLKAAIAALPQVSSIALVDPDINVLRVFGARGPNAIERDNWRDDAAFVALVGRAQRAHAAFWGPMFVAETTGATLLNLVVPPDPNDHARHVVIVSVATNDLSRFLAAIGNEITGSSFVLVNRAQVLAHPMLVDNPVPVSDAAPLPALEGFIDPILAAIWSGERLRGLERQFENGLEARVAQTSAGTVAYLFHEVDRFGDQPWQIGSYFQLDRLAPHIAGTRAFLITSVIVLLMAMLLAVLAGRLLARPIGRLSATARRLREWDLAAIPPQQSSPLREIDDATNALYGAVDRLKAFEAYVPRPVAKRLLSGAAGGPIESEIRDATVMFTDIAGFTAWSEPREPAEIVAFLNAHVAMVTAIVRGQGGIVDKFIGDSVMAFWLESQGEAPHPVRAAKAALQIAQRFEEAATPQADLPDRLRIGLHTGSLICGNIGPPERVNYTVIGDTVNVAQRLESLAREFAKPERRTEIVISADMAAALDAGFDMRPLGEQAIRGRRRRMILFELVSDRTERKA